VWIIGKGREEVKGKGKKPRLGTTESVLHPNPTSEPVLASEVETQI
jgi:hypothetical protein